jgi:hypothetical protein
MSIQRFVLLASPIAVALTAIAVSAFAASDPVADASPACVAVAPDAELEALDLEMLDLETLELDEVDSATAAANWTHWGCISLGGNCYDVFRDTKGNLWVCLACFTTLNPGPGKCRKLTPYEIANARWCA